MRLHTLTLCCCLLLAAGAAADETTPAAIAVNEAAAIKHLEAGDFESAVAVLEATVRLAPERASTQQALAYALDRLGRLDDAISAYERAAALAPDDALTLNNLGAALTRVGEHDRALAVLERAIELDPDSELAQQNLDTARKNIDTVRAINAELLAARLAAEASPTDPVAAYRVARILAHRGNADQAMQWLSRSFERGFPDPRLPLDDPAFAKLRDDPRLAATIEATTHTP